MKVKQLMPGQVEGQQCGGKICYKTKAAALKAMKSAREKRRTRKAHVERRVYRCPYCRFWHVTSLSIEKGKEFGSQARERREVMQGIRDTLSGSLPADEAFEVLARMNEDRLAGKGMSSVDSYIAESLSEELKKTEESKKMGESSTREDPKGIGESAQLSTKEDLKGIGESAQPATREAPKGIGESAQPATREAPKGIGESAQPATREAPKGITPFDSNNSTLDRNNHSSDGNNKLLDTNNDERTDNMSDAVPSPADVARKHAVVYTSKDIRSTVKRVPVPGGVLLILPKSVVVMPSEKSKALRHLGIVEEL